MDRFEAIIKGEKIGSPHPERRTLIIKYRGDPETLKFTAAFEAGETVSDEAIESYFNALPLWCLECERAQPRYRACLRHDVVWRLVRDIEWVYDNKPRKVVITERADTFYIETNKWKYIIVHDAENRVIYVTVVPNIELFGDPKARKVTFTYKATSKSLIPSYRVLLTKMVEVMEKLYYLITARESIHIGKVIVEEM